MTDEDIQAASRLKEIWESKKKSLALSQVSAARQLGISQPSVFKYLNGKIPLGVKAILSWAKLLRVHPAEIKPDIADLLSSHIVEQTIPLVAEITDGGKTNPLSDATVTITSPIQGEVKGIMIKTTVIPGYFHGQIVLFDTRNAPKRDRHAVTREGDSYYISKYENDNWVDLHTGRPVPPDADLYALVGSFFED